MAISSPNSRSELIRINPRLPIVPQVHTTLHHLIVHCVLPPGSTIREKDLSKQMEVSRTPMRGELLQLEKEGLVEIYPQSGTHISKISMEEVRECHFIREAMESAKVRFVVQHGDSKLHNLPIQFATNLDFCLSSHSQQQQQDLREQTSIEEEGIPCSEVFKH